MTKKLIYIKIDISCREGSIPSCRYIKAQTENNAPLGAPAGGIPLLVYRFEKV